MFSIKKDIYESVRTLEKKAGAIYMDKSLIPVEGIEGVHRDYNRRLGEVYEEFKTLVFKNSEFAGMERGRAIFEEVFAEAWESGHDAGYHEVYNHFIGLETLTVSVLKIALSD